MNERAEGDIYSTHTGALSLCKTQSEITLENTVIGNETRNETLKTSAEGMEGRECGGTAKRKNHKRNRVFSFSPEKRRCSQKHSPKMRADFKCSQRIM